MKRIQRSLTGVSGSCRTDWDWEGEGCFERRIGVLPALLRVCSFRVSPLFQLPASEGHSASQDSKEWTLMADRLHIWKKLVNNAVTFQLEEHCHPGGNSTESLSLQVDPSFRELVLRNGVKSLVSLWKESMPNWLWGWSAVNEENAAKRLRKIKHRIRSITL